MSGHRRALRAPLALVLVLALLLAACADGGEDGEVGGASSDAASAVDTDAPEGGATATAEGASVDSTAVE